MLKRCRTMLCLVEQEGTDVVIVVCYDRRAYDADEPRYDRSNFCLRCVDFCVPYEIGRKYVETVPYDAVLCRAGRGECAGSLALATRVKTAVCIEIRSFKFRSVMSIFVLPTK